MTKYTAGEWRIGDAGHWHEGWYAELSKLHRLWATGKATRIQIERCMELDRKFERIRAALANDKAEGSK